METTYLSGLDRVEGVATLLIMALGGALVAALASRLVRTSKIIRPMLLGLALDTLVLFVLIIAFGSLDADARLWHSLGTVAAQNLTEDISAQYSTVLSKEGKEGYIWILGLLYVAGGPTPLLGVALNLIARGLTIAVVARTTQELADEAGISKKLTDRSVMIAGYITALLPCFAIWAPQLLRESLTVLLISVTVCVAVVLCRKRSVVPLLVIIAALALLAWIRQTLGVSVGIAVIFALLFVLLGRSLHARMFRMILTIVAVPAIPLLLQQVLAIIGMESDSIIGTTADLSETASSGFPGLSDGTSLTTVFLITVPRVIAGPFPWEMNGEFVMLLAFIDLACWLLVLSTSLLAVRLFREGKLLARANWMLPLVLITVAALVLGLSMITGNYGLLARFRPTVTILLIPLSAFWFGHSSMLYDTGASATVGSRGSAKLATLRWD
ncbi:hypothetical protein [Brachybacterium paraconglomeratum]|uniref:hypothetical protein n=1 Tax=Brachybacterium paraconglomeratum TaxID=173362 RepID=UPI00380F37BB